MTPDVETALLAVLDDYQQILANIGQRRRVLDKLERRCLNYTKRTNRVLRQVRRMLREEQTSGEEWKTANGGNSDA